MDKQGAPRLFGLDPPGPPGTARAAIRRSERGLSGHNTLLNI